jgi:outer membrane protein OmpA-like peptidoglycan-associated protein
LPERAPTQAKRAGQIVFSGESADLSAEARRTLDGLVASLAANEKLHLELLGYSAPTKDTGQARRIALARTLAVRTYLVDLGVKPNRVDVRALGDRVQDSPEDRVDLMLAER